MTAKKSFDHNLLRALEVFSTVVEHGQVTRAAKVLGITQSAASQHLASLERSFGCQVIDRGVRPLQLTKAGIALHQRAQQLLAQVEELRGSLRRIEGAPLPVLRIGMLASVATTLTPVVLHVTRRLRGIPAVTAYAGLSSDHQQWLAAKRTDLVVTSDAFYDIDGLERMSLLRERFLLILPRGYAAHEGSQPLDDLARLAESLPLVRFSPETGVGRRVDQHLRRLRLPLPRVIDADRASMVVSAVAAGHGFSILCPTLLIDALKEGWPIEARPLPIPEFSREIHLIHRVGELEDLPRQLFVGIAAALRGAFETLLPNLPEGTVRFTGPSSEGGG
ncbi:MAG: hypothetical protein Kilf2KO_45620 [Rhodospirillales bacterium]